jgi:hypothetical protein
MKSSHDRYRDALAALAADEAILVAVAAAGERNGWWTPDRPWRRIYGRFTPDSTAFADLVFTSDTPTEHACRVQVFDRRPDSIAGSYIAEGAAAGWIAVVPALCDSWRPPAPSPGARLVRYHPGRRCTYRVVDTGHARFAKVYADNRGARVYADLVSLRAELDGESRLSIPEPLAWDPRSHTLWLGEVPGCPAAERLRGQAGVAVAGRIGASVGLLTRARVAPSAVIDNQAAIARSRRHACELGRRIPDLAVCADAVVDRLVAVHARWTSDLRPIHGAPHPDQWLDADPAVGLVDFDRFALGEPEMDAGIFIGDLHALGGTAIPVEQLASAFLDGCRNDGPVLSEALVRAYRVHHQLAKALRAAQALRPDGDERAARLTSIAGHAIQMVAV